MIGLGLSENAKLEFVWINNPKVLIHSDPNIRFDLSYFSFFIENFVHLGLFFYTLYFLKFFIRE